MRTAYQVSARLERSDRELGAQHALLIAKVAANTSEYQAKHFKDERLIAALEAQQKSWLEYRRHECELVGTLSGAGGNWPSVYNLECQLDLADQRLGRVREVARCLDKLPAGKGFFEQHTCLERLTPLAGKK